MKPLPWLEHHFNFDFNVGMYPAFYERLAGTPPRLEEFTSKIDSALLTRKINGKWSIQEHIGHLLDLEALHEGRLDDFKAGKSILRPADMKNQKTENADHNGKDMINLLLSFKKARQQFLDRLNDFSDEEISNSALHERLGIQMRVVDLVYFASEHDDHHIALMRELLNNKF